jgi:hypothetical protein
MNPMTDSVKPTRLRVTQGAVRVNSAQIVRCWVDLALVHVDLSSKYAVKSATGRLEDSLPMVALEATPETLSLDTTRPGVPTLIEFLDFPGWDVEVSAVSKYTLRVCLFRRSEEDPC